MSRIGRMPIAIPAGVTVEVAENNKVTVKGPKGTLERVLPAEMEIKVEGAEVVSTTYYTTSGAASATPVKGVNIVKYVYSDGTVKSVKFFNK